MVNTHAAIANKLNKFLIFYLLNPTLAPQWSCIEESVELAFVYLTENKKRTYEKHFHHAAPTTRFYKYKYFSSITFLASIF